jgi:glyoxylase-like metal-dependent hydrolase (beta-lactamase superfamily II)
MRCRVTLPLIACVMTISASQAPAAEPAPAREWRLQKITEGVYAALEPERLRFFDSNSTIIIGPKDVVVVDTQTVPSVTRAMLAEIRKITDKPIRWVIDTHWHNDHVQGAEAFIDQTEGLTVIAHSTVEEDIRARGAKQLQDEIDGLPAQIAAQRKAVETGLDEQGKPIPDDVKPRVKRGLDWQIAHLDELVKMNVVIPSMTYEDRMTLWQGTREIRLIHVRAHTRGDTLVYLPQEKVLHTGDVLDDLPYAGHGYPSEWLAALKEIGKMDVNVILPGHGRPHEGKYAKDHIALITELFQSAVDQAKAAVKTGVPLEEAKTKVDLESFRPRLAGTDPVATRNFNDFIPALIDRAVAEAKGKLKD